MSDLPLPKLKRSFPFVHEAVLAVAVIALLVTAKVIDPSFVTLRTQFDYAVAGDLWPLAMLALPMTLIILTGGIDLSVGSIVALCAVVLGLSFQNEFGVPVAIALTLAVGAAAGALNGAIIAGLRVHPLIVTLATMSAFRGIALAVGGSAAIAGFPPEWRRIVQGTFAGVPYPLWTIGTLAILTGFFLWRTSYGRFLYAIGHNATAARFSGVPVRAMRFWLYTLSGFCCALAAILITAPYRQAKADMASALELNVITAVVLGGVSIFGGRGNLVGVALGVVLLHVAQKFVTMHFHRSDLNPLVVGGLLIGSVLINSLVTRRRSHR